MGAASLQWEEGFHDLRHGRTEKVPQRAQGRRSDTVRAVAEPRPRGRRQLTSWAQPPQGRACPGAWPCLSGLLRAEVPALGARDGMQRVHELGWRN